VPGARGSPPVGDTRALGSAAGARKVPWTANECKGPAAGGRGFPDDLPSGIRKMAGGDGGRGVANGLAEYAVPSLVMPAQRDPSLTDRQD